MRPVRLARRRRRRDCGTWRTWRTWGGLDGGSRGHAHRRWWLRGLCPRGSTLGTTRSDRSCCSRPVLTIPISRRRRSWSGSPTAGHRCVDQLAALDWGFDAAGSASGPRMAIPSGRVMGGSGAINGTIFLRGTPEDFASWATLVGPEWGWDQIAPAYRAIEADPFGADADHGRAARCPSSTGPRPTGSRPRRRSTKRASRWATASPPTTTRPTRWASVPCRSTSARGRACHPRWRS